METVSIALLCTVTGVIISYFTLQRNKHKDIRADTKEEAETITKISEEIKYVSKSTDDIKYEIRSTNKSISDMNERLIRVEESCKSAHKRIDNLEEK